MITREQINGQVNAIIDTVQSLSQAGRIRYYINVVNSALGRNPIEICRGSNADNNNVEKQQKWYYGDDMIHKFAEHLKQAVANKSHSKVHIIIKDGGNTVKGEYNIILKEDDTADEQTSPVGGYPAAAQGLAFINDLLGAAFGGLGGTEQNGIGAIIGVRDQMLRSEYEKRDMERQHKIENEAIRAEFEHERAQKELEDIKSERDKYRQKAEELQNEINQSKVALEERNHTIDKLQERVDELEQMKPEASIAGVALTGIATKALEALALRHAGTIGKLMGVDKEEMLGMLTGDLQEPQPTVAESAVDTPTVEAADAPQDNVAQYTSQLAEVLRQHDADYQRKFSQIVSHILASDDNLNTIYSLVANNE